MIMIKIESGSTYSVLLDMPIDAVMHLMYEAKAATYYKGYEWNHETLIHYLIAHYVGDMVDSTFVPYYPLEKYDANL